MRFVDPLYTNNFLDANIFDQVAGGESDAVLEILRIYDNERISLLLPYSVQAEIEDPKTPEPVRKASRNFNYSIKVELTKGERDLYEKLLREVSGNAEPKNIAQDLFHVFEAQKNGGGHFITLDKRLLARGDAIARVLQIEVLTPDAFARKVYEAKQRQAEFERARVRDESDKAP